MNAWKTCAVLNPPVGNPIGADCSPLPSGERDRAELAQARLQRRVRGPYHAPPLTPSRHVGTGELAN